MNTNLQNELIYLDKLWTNLLFERKLDILPIRKQLEEDSLEFYRELLFESLQEILTSKTTIKMIFKFILKFQKLLSRRHREKIIFSLFRILIGFDRNNYSTFDTTYLLRKFNENLNLNDELIHISHETEKVIEEKLTSGEILNYNDFSDNYVIFGRKVFKFHLKFLLLFFFGDVYELKNLKEDSYVNKLFEFFTKLFKFNTSFSDIILKQISDLLFSRKVFSTSTISSYTVSSFFKELIINPHFEKFNFLENLMKTFVFYEENKVLFAKFPTKKRRHVFEIFFILKERFFSPNRHTISEYKIETNSLENKITKSTEKFYDYLFYNNENIYFKKFQEILYLQKNLSFLFHLESNDFKVLKDIEYYQFFYTMEYLFNDQSNGVKKKSNLFKNIPCYIKIHFIKKLLESENFENSKFSIISMLLDIYTKILKHNKMEIDQLDNITNKQEISKNHFYRVFLKIENIFKNSDETEKLQKLLTLNKCEFSDLLLITRCIISKLDANNVTFCLTNLIPNIQNISEPVLIPFLNFLMLLIKNKKFLNSNSQDRIYTSIIQLIELIKYIPLHLDDKHTVILYCFVLNIFSYEEIKQQIINFEPAIITDLYNKVSNGNYNLNDMKAENFKLILINYIFNAFKLGDEQEIFLDYLYQIIIIQTSILADYVQNINNDNYKYFTNMLHRNMNFLSCSLKNVSNKNSDNTHISYYDIYCQNEKCQKKLKNDKKIVLNRFLYLCHWCRHPHNNVDFNSELNNSRNFKKNFNFIIISLKEIYFNKVLNCATFLNIKKNDQAHIFLKIFYIYSNFLFENWDKFNFSPREMMDIKKELKDWEQILNSIYEEFYTKTNLEHNQIKQVQKSVDQIEIRIKQIIHKILN